MLARTRIEVKGDHIPLLSAGIAFYALLALVPALVAVISVYGLVADAGEVRNQILHVLSAAPREVRELLSTQLESIVGSSGAGTVVAAIIGTLTAIWSASSGLDHLIDALNVAYDEHDDRGFVRRKLLALSFTLGAVVFMVIAFVTIALLPALIAQTGIGTAGRVIVGVLRWVVLLGGMQVGLAVLYRYGPDRDAPKWRWVSAGAVVASLLWIVASIAFSVYTANFAKYNETYGSLGAVVILMLWLFLTALAVLVGAEINAETERQTERDTTEGRPKRMGERNAHAADTLGAADGDVDEPSPALGTASLVFQQHAELPFRFAGIVGFAARLFGVRADRAHAVISEGRLSVRYGRWILSTPLTNVAVVDVTGPYRAWRVAGPPHLSFSDSGLTFATNRDRGVCVSFHEPVPGLLPFGLLRHPGLTFTVAEPDRCAEQLRTEVAAAAAPRSDARRYADNAAHRIHTI